MKTLMKAGTGLLFNMFMGAMIALVVGFSAGLGAFGAVALSIGLGAFMPSGCTMAGVLTEVWTGELVKKLRSGTEASFLDGLPDYSQYSENDVIHLVDVGADPEVLVNNTTYPIPLQDLKDGDIAISLDKFQTKVTPITDDELYALSYDKMASVKERHGDAILEKKFAKSIHALCPNEDKPKTPVIKTTGINVDGRKALTTTDIIALKKKFDDLQVPTVGRRLVLCNDHVNDLLLNDQKFAQQYYNYTTGKISNLYSFEVFEYVANPVFKADGKKKPFGANVVAGEHQASVAFYVKNTFKATGSTEMYYSEAKTDPQHQRSLVNFRHRFLVLPKKQEAIGAIISDKAAAATT